MFKKLLISFVSIITIFFSTASMSADLRILKLWDQFENFGMSAAGPAFEKIIAECKNENEGVELARSVFGGGWPIRNAVELALTTGDAPDVFYTWPSGAGLTAYAKEGYLLDLTPYAKKYGWFDRLPDWAIERNAFEGKLYAYPWEQDLEYVYYNKSIFEEIGQKIPTNWEEILGWCDNARANGYTPIAYSDAGAGWQAANTITDIFAMVGGRELGLDILQNREKWNNPKMHEALDMFKEMVDRKCFTDGFLGIEYGEQLAEFYSGDATATWTGTWVLQSTVSSMDAADLDIFYMPAVKGNKQSSHFSEGSAFYISADTKHPDLAAQFVDYVTQPRWLQTWIDDGYCLVIQRDELDWSQFKAPPVVVKAMKEGIAFQDDMVDAFHTTVAPNVVQTLYSGMQGVLSGSTSNDEFLDSMDAASADASELGNVWNPGDWKANMN